MADGSGERDGRTSKVARIIETEDRQDLGAELEARWTATGEDHWSLRDLATYFNRELVRERLYEAGLNPTEIDVENTYQLLVEDDGTESDRTQLRRQLEHDDVDELERDVVTYQAIRSYLQEVRGAEYDPETGDRVESASSAIQKLRARLVSVAETKLDQLRDTSRLTLGEFRVIVDVRVLCTECNSRYALLDLLDTGGCDCADD